jgi:hypothetical protein
LKDAQDILVDVLDIWKGNVRVREVVCRVSKDGRKRVLMRVV